MQEKLKKNEEMIKKRTNASKLEFCKAKYKNKAEFLIRGKRFFVSFMKK